MGCKKEKERKENGEIGWFEGEVRSDITCLGRGCTVHFAKELMQNIIRCAVGAVLSAGLNGSYCR